MHWGLEYAPVPDQRETYLADALRQAAVSLIVGAHPHVADQGLAALAGGEALLAYSLGNFLFDQPSSRASGAVLEVRFFPQGTFFARRIPIPNFYDRALGLR
jgi:poly-gamma-glutamate synthesis protein (capsule biosynthesis protein)